MIKSIQYGTVTIASGATSGTAAVTSVGTAVLMMLGKSNDATGSTFSSFTPADVDARITLTNATTITATRGNNPAFSITVAFVLIELMTAAELAAGIFGTSLGTEGYAANGAVPTLAQMMFMLWSATAQFDISSTTIAAKKLDGSTDAMEFTMDSTTTPTQRVRSL